jgi:EmrB/QacA subfamily drug resistance transporter
MNTPAPKQTGQSAADAGLVHEPPALRIIPWIVAIAFFMQMLDTSVLNTALPSIARSLGESPLNLHWAVIAYVLAVAVLMPVSGWLADRFGVRKVLFSAIVVFAAGSVLCATSRSLGFLIFARAAQGVGGAFMMPVGRLIILRSYPRRQLVQVLSFVSIPALIGPLMGPALGGFLVEYASWHWIFLINVPVGAVGCLAVLRYIPDLRGTVRARFDLPGFLLFGAAMLLASFALDGAGQKQFSNPLLGGLGGGGALCFALYVLHARRYAQPLFSLALFKIRSFSVGIAGNIFARLAGGGMPYLTPLLLQVLLGYSPFKAGLVMVPMTVMAIFSKALATRLLNRFSYRRVLFVNTALLGCLIASYSFLAAGTPLWVTLILFSVFGAVNSLQFTAMNTLTLIGLPDEMAASGNSLLSVVMQLALGLGVAAAAGGLALFRPAGLAVSAGGLAEAFRLTYFCMGGLSLAAAFIFLLTPPDLNART